MSTQILIGDDKGREWAMGQRVSIPSMDYEGRITGIYPSGLNQPARVMVSRDGDRFPRNVTLDKLEALP